MCSLAFSKVVLQLYYHTGADALSGFFGHGKKSVMRNILKYIPDIAKSLEDVGAISYLSRSA